MSKAEILKPNLTDLTTKYARQLEVITHLNQMVSADEKVERILQTALSYLLHTLRYQAAQIYRLSPSGRDLWLYLELDRGHEMAIRTTDIFSIEEENIVTHAVRRSEPVYVADIHSQPHAYFPDSEKHFISATHPHSELALPLKYGAGTIGVLCIQSQRADGFEPVDISFLASLASLLASTIKTSQMIQKLQDELQEVKILYNLQRNEELSQPEQGDSRLASGYEYSDDTLVKSTNLTASAQLALKKDQIGATTAGYSDSTELVRPIKLYGETIGVLGIEEPLEGREWLPEDISLLEEVSSQVGLAIENARLLQQTRERTQELSILVEASSQLSETIDLPQIYQILTDQMITYLNADNCAVLLLNKTRTQFEVMVEKSRNDSGDMISHNAPRTEVIGQSPCLQEMIQTPAVMIQYLNQADPGATGDKYLNRGPHRHTLIMFPLLVRNKLVGLLEVGHRQQQRDYGRSELQLAQAIVARVTVAIENAQLFQQTQMALLETQKLYDISRSLVESTSLDDIFAVITSSVLAYDIDRVSISLLDYNPTGEIDSVTIAASWDKDSEAILPVGAKISTQSYSLVRAFAQPPFSPLISEDLSRADGQDPRMDDAFRRFMQETLGAVTMFAAPMFLGNEYKGVLSISTRQPHTYTDQEIRIYLTLTDQALIAIENQRLFEATKQNLFHSQILSHLSQDLLVADTPDTIYNLTLTATSTTKPERGTAIFMYDQEEGNVNLELVALWENPDLAWPTINLGTRFSVEELGLGPLLKTGQTVFSTHATTDPRFTEMLQQLLMIMQIQVLVAVPIWLNRDVGGFILIGGQEEKVFSPETIRLYEDISRQTSGALENHRLFEEAQYRASLLQTAAEVSQAAIGTLELTNLLPQMVELIRDRFGYYHVSIYLVDEYRRFAVVEASAGEAGPQMLAMKYRLEVGGKSIVGVVTATGKPRIALDVGQEAVYFNNPMLPDTHSEIALPLVARSQVIGALDAHSAAKSAFSQSDITILQSMVNQLANAIEAARAFQASQNALAEVRNLHEYYLQEQWSTFFKQQQMINGYRLNEDNHLTQTDTWSLPAEIINRVSETKQPILTLLDGSTPTGLASNASKGGTSPAQPATIVAPLALHGQVVIGAIDLEQLTPDQLWGEDELTIVEAVTGQAAEAIEAVRLFQLAQSAREEALALYRVGRSLSASENEQEMLHIVLHEMLAILGLRQGGILFIEEDGQYGQLHALFKNGEPVEPNLRIPITGNRSYEELIATRKPVIIEDMSSDARVAAVREMDLAPGLTSLLLVPIIINDRVVGALGADSIGKKHLFTEREINLVSAMADQLAVILQNRRLLSETQRHAVQLQTSFEVSQVATSILDQEAMLSQAVELIKDRFGFYYVQIFLIDETKQFAVLYKSSSHLDQLLPTENYRVAVGSDSIVGQVTYQRRPLVARDTDTGYRGKLFTNSQLLPQTRAELAIPLQVGETILGVLEVQSANASAFSSEEIASLETLAAQLSIAIQNARAFTEQQQTAEQLKAMDKLKTQFLANMSHELRTPLNSIIGFSRVILKGIDGPLTDLQKTDLTSIHNSGQHLLSLINNILDLSKIEAGKMELNIEEVELEPIIKGVMSTAIALVKDKPVDLLQDVPDNLPKLWADPTRLRQITLNLVSNACKFTDEGSITIRARADTDTMTISVTDTGIGIPQEKLDSVFEEFTQVDASTTRKVGGTGLGLPISRHFVEMHKGQMWVESRLGYGSIFSYSIPLKLAEEESEEETPASSPVEATPLGQRKTIVAIDDDRGVTTLYERYLEPHNYQIIGISDSYEVLPQIKEVNPVVILLDVLMPKKDGWGVLRNLKDDPQTKDIPVIICSIISDKKRAFSMGAADYLVKPIVEQDLVSAVRHLESLTKNQIKVLVIDDQADDILLIRRMLEAQAYKIIEARDGTEGLDLVHTYHPDLIILDLTMPQLDGFGVIQALKNNEKTQNIPIIIVSAKELDPTEQQLLTGQVEVLLRKGIFTDNELLADVSLALKRIRAAEMA